MKLVFAEIMRELKASGYRVSARLLNAMYFHVPQSRERLIIIGVREDLGVEASHPKAQDGLVSVSQAWQQLQQFDADMQPALLRDTWQMQRVLQGNEPKRHFGLVRIVLNEPSSTVVKDAGNTTTGMIHPFRNRRLTIPEIKRLSAYPDTYRTNGGYKVQWSLIGNGVPPLFMRAIARHIRTQILAPATMTGLGLAPERIDG